MAQATAPLTLGDTGTPHSVVSQEPIFAVPHARYGKSQSPRASLGLFRPLSRTSRHSLRTTSAPDPALQHAQPMEYAHLTFFQRHFTKPVDKEPDKMYKPSNRRFAFVSHGSIVAGLAMLLTLLAVIAAAVAVTLDRHHAPSATPPQSPKVPSPIRAALDDNFPDPTIWYSNGTYYALATNNAAGILLQTENSTAYDYGASNVQIATSTDFVTWDLLNSSYDPLPTLGEWVTPGMTIAAPRIPRGNVWAPGLNQRKSDGKFVLYYSAGRRNATNPSPHHPPPHCIGAAVSRGTSPAGPYDPVANTLACPVDQGGAIDAAGFQDDDGSLFVIWKVDGNNIGHGGLCGNMVHPIVPTPLMLQKMLPDGLTADGKPVQLLDRTKADGPLIEAPALVKSPEGIYFLFFSSGCTRSPTYDVKYATSRNITGPYTRARNPLLETGDWGLLAPGSVGIHDDSEGGYNMAFHARVTAPQGRIRAMFTTKLSFDGHLVHLVADNGTTT